MDAERDKRPIVLGEVLRQARLKSGLSIREVLTKAGYHTASPSMLSKAESGTMTPSFDTLNNVGDILGLQIPSLLEKLGYAQGEYKSRKYAKPKDKYGIQQRAEWTKALVQEVILKNYSPDPSLLEAIYNVITEIHTLPLILDAMKDWEQEDDRRNGAATFLLQMFLRDPNNFPEILSMYVRSCVDWGLYGQATRDDFKNWNLVILEPFYALWDVLMYGVAAEPANAVRLLQAGLSRDVAGFFVLPIATTCTTPEGIAVKRILRRWTKSSRNPAVHDVVRLIISVMSTIARLQETTKLPRTDY